MLSFTIFTAGLNSNNSAHIHVVISRYSTDHTDANKVERRAREKSMFNTKLTAICFIGFVTKYTILVHQQVHFSDYIAII